jgi:transcriptional regulator with XRE-family HTH domain
METEVHLLPGNQIDPAAAESIIADKHIGERIKRLRVKKSMGLTELGRHTGLSASFLSQLETGRVVPTLRNLARIAIVFGKDLSYFFASESHTLFRIHRKKERVRLPQTGVDDPTYYFESLGHMVPDRHLDPYYTEFIPLKKNAGARLQVHPGHEFLYLLEGVLEIRHADKAYVLEAGDVAYFDASAPHNYRCVSETPAVAIIVTMHQQQPLASVDQSLGSKNIPATRSVPEEKIAGKAGSFAQRTQEPESGARTERTSR